MVYMFYITNEIYIDKIKIIDYISVVKPEGISRSADEDHKYKQIADQVKQNLINRKIEIAWNQ